MIIFTGIFSSHIPPRLQTPRYHHCESLVGQHTALSAEDTEKVVSYLENLQHTYSLGEELVAAVSARLPANRLSVPGSADAHLGMEVQGLRIATGFENTVALWVVVKASLEWELDQAKPKQTTRNFACQTQPLALADRLNTNESDARQELSICIDDLALQIWTALQEPSTDSDLNSTIGFGNYDPATDEW